MALTCPNCGNDRNFLVKTLQMHVVQVRDDARVEANEEGRPAVIEVLCDECEKELSFSEFEENVRNELLLTLGARCKRASDSLVLACFGLFEVVAFRADPLAQRPKPPRGPSVLGLCSGFLVWSAASVPPTAGKLSWRSQVRESVCLDRPRTGSYRKLRGRRRGGPCLPTIT